MRRTFASLAPILLLAALVGCDETSQMGIDSDSTTANPSEFQRSIPEDAVADDVQGTQSVSEQVANTERDQTGPPQGESLEGTYDLDDLRGRRVLLVFAGSPEVPEYERLKAAWKENETAAKERNLALVEALLRGRSPAATKTLSEGESQVMRSRYGVQPAAFKVMLIGEDGKTIAEGDDLTLDKAFEEIDGAVRSDDPGVTP